jgi:hypothetical protein
MKSLIVVILVLVFYPLTADCAITKEFGPYSGKVIDAESKEPIEGAAVLVVFYTESYGPAGAIIHYADALETITDKNGEFEFPSHRITLFRPLQGWVKHGYFTIFKPGYGCYPLHRDVKPIFVPNGTLPEDKQVIIELPKLKTRIDRIESTHCSPQSYVSYSKAKNFIDSINKENKSLGLGIEQYK